MKNKKIIAMLVIVAVLVVACAVAVSAYLNSTIYSNYVPTVENTDEHAAVVAPEAIEIITEDEFNLGQHEPIDIEAPIESPEPIYKTVAISDRIYNVLIIGDDARRGTPRGHSDTQILCSFNRDTKEIKMVSFMRDILIPTTEDKWNRINTPYMSGGPGKAINTLNKIFSLDIQRYVIVRFDSVFALVDKIDGIDISITKDEADYVNRIFPEYDQLSAGLAHMNGRQCLAFARARKVGGSGDFERTRRQRDVIKAAFAKVRQNRDASSLSALIQFAVENIETNIPLDEIFTMAMEILTSGSAAMGELRIPIDNSYTFAKYQEASILTINFKKNIQALHTLLYGTYQGVKIPDFGKPIFDDELLEETPLPTEGIDDPAASFTMPPVPGTVWDPTPSPSPSPEAMPGADESPAPPQ